MGTDPNPARAALRDNVTGAIERGDAESIAEVPVTAEVTVALKVTVDRASWAREYGLALEDVEDDVEQYVAAAVENCYAAQAQLITKVEEV